MSGTAARRPFPLAPLIGAGLLIGFSIALAAAYRLSGTHDLGPQSNALAARELRFADQADGGVRVIDAGDGHTVAVLPPGTNGFLRATLRGLARERRREEEPGLQTPFRLTAWTDGRVTLDDLATGRRVELEAFGQTNEAVFARLLEIGPVRADPMAADATGAGQNLARSASP